MLCYICDKNEEQSVCNVKQIEYVLIHFYCIQSAWYGQLVHRVMLSVGCNVNS